MRRILCLLCLISSIAFADTKGLNQVITSHITDDDALTYSLQSQHNLIGNPLMSQVEFGLDKKQEMAVWWGHNPSEISLAWEQRMWASKCFELSSGTFYVFKTNDVQSFTVGSYSSGKHMAEIGAMRVSGRLQTFTGYSFTLNNNWQLQADFMTGGDNYQTVGFTYSYKNLSINPALYRANSDSKLYPYIVATFVFKK